MTIYAWQENQRRQPELHCDNKIILNRIHPEIDHHLRNSQKWITDKEENSRTYTIVQFKCICAHVGAWHPDVFFFRFTFSKFAQHCAAADNVGLSLRTIYSFSHRECVDLTDPVTILLFE